QRNLGFFSIILAALQRFSKPSVSRFPARLGPAVRIVKLEVADLVAHTHDFKNAFRFGISGSRAVNWEIVFNGGGHVDRLGSKGDQEVRKIQAIFEEVGENLLSILR